jgi:hypothetical protein
MRRVVRRAGIGNLKRIKVRTTIQEESMASLLSTSRLGAEGPSKGVRTVMQ